MMADKKKIGAIEKLSERVRAEFAEKPSASIRNWLAVLALAASGVYAIVSIVPVKLWSPVLLALWIAGTIFLFVRRAPVSFSRKDIWALLLPVVTVTFAMFSWGVFAAQLMLRSMGGTSTSQPSSELLSAYSVAFFLINAIGISCLLLIVVVVYRKLYLVAKSDELREWVEVLAQVDAEHESRISTLEEVTGVDDHDYGS